MWIFSDEDKRHKITALAGRKIKILSLMPPDCYADERQPQFIGRTGTVRLDNLSPFLIVDLDGEINPCFAFRRVEFEFIDDPDGNY